MKKAIDLLLLSSIATSAALRSIYSLFVCMIVSVFPETMKIRAIASYLHENFSPRRQMAKIELATIAVAELHDRRTISAKGSTTTQKTEFSHCYESF